MAGLNLGVKIDRAATRAFTPVVARMAQNRLTGKLAVSLSHYAGLAALGVGYTSWEAGGSLRAVAEEAGVETYLDLIAPALSGSLQPEPAGYLEKGWIIANHKLVSFHAAFISSVLSLPDSVDGKLDTLRFMFLSAETAVSLVILYTSWHVGIAIHEIGHYVTAAKLTALNSASQSTADTMRSASLGGKIGWYANMFMKIPWGNFEGVKNDGGNYSPDAPYNLAVAAAGPRWSAGLALTALPLATLAIAGGLIAGNESLIVAGRFLMAPGLVGLLDRLMADPGKLKEFVEREAKAAQAAEQAASGAVQDLFTQLLQVKNQLTGTRMITVTTADGKTISAPWQWRNCAMGGRHTEKEYPESNVSMQESMFIPLSVKSYEDAQEMTTRLQARLKEIIENSQGGRVMGIGLEGGIAPYIEKEPEDVVPEQRLWRMMKQAILDCGYKPGVDVAIALDPAASELENAYRAERNEPDSVGLYMFWRDRAKVTMSRDEVMALYKKAIIEDGVPIVSIEDGFGERDHAGWALLMKELGDRILVIGDDLVTTNDAVIEECSQKGLMNASLIKANQIGTLTETILAMLTSLAYGCELVVSHRSKSPNDPFEAELTTALNAVGQKTGGGANTERLQKYGRVVEILSLAQARARALSAGEQAELAPLLKDLVRTLTGQAEVTLVANFAELDITSLVIKMLAVEAVIGTEQATNAGIPTGAATILLDRQGIIRFDGATPLGSSAGEGEAVHLVDSMVKAGPLTEKYAAIFDKKGDGTYRFKKSLNREAILEQDDQELTTAWDKAQRFSGKGCLNAVANIQDGLGRLFVGKRLADLGGLLEIDRALLQAEVKQARQEGLLAAGASPAEIAGAMQAKSALGMNAILSMSLALGRTIAARDGQQLNQVIRQTAMGAMARFIVANDAKTISFDQLMDLGVDELIREFRAVAKNLIADGKEIHPLLRAQLPVYEIIEQVAIGDFAFNLAGFAEKSRQRLAQLSQVFVPAGSVQYDAKMVEGKPWLKVDEASRSGLGADWQSRAVGAFFEARDHKGEVFIDRSIWVDEVHVGKRGEKFTGCHSVLIPQRAIDDQGRIMLLLGRFEEPKTARNKLQIFADSLADMNVFAGQHADLDASAVQAKIAAAFVRIPVAEFFLRAPRELYETYIGSELNGQA